MWDWTWIERRAWQSAHAFANSSGADAYADRPAGLDRVIAPCDRYRGWSPRRRGDRWRELVRWSITHSGAESV